MRASEVCRGDVPHDPVDRLKRRDLDQILVAEQHFLSSLMIIRPSRIMQVFSSRSSRL